LPLAEFEAWTVKSIAYTLQAPEELLYRKLNNVMIRVGIRLHVARVWEGGKIGGWEGGVGGKEGGGAKYRVLMRKP